MATEMTSQHQLDDLARWSRRVYVIIDELVPDATQTLDAAGRRGSDTSKLKAELLRLIKRIDDPNSRAAPYPRPALSNQRLR